MKKFLFAFASALILCVPALADSDVYFAETPFAATINNNTFVYNCPDAYICATYSSDGNNVVFQFFAPQQSTCNVTLNGNSWRTYNTTLHEGNWYIGALNDPTVTEINNGVILPINSIFPWTATYADKIASLESFIAGGSGGTVSSVNVPRGNVLYFQVASNSDVNFVSHFSENSGLFSSGNVYGPWGDTYQRISSEASLPSAGIEFPRAGSDAIVWDKGEPLNVLGQTKVGVFTKSCTAGTYYAFYNPAYQSISTSDGFGSTSVGSNVTVSGAFSFIRIYSLQQIYDISTSVDNYDTYYVGTPDGDGGVTWVDQDNQVNYPSSGGENQEDEPISSVSLIESIKRILRNILSEIESIFTFGFSAIRDLVDLMDEFVATFDDLYEWLPEECYTLLIACVSVAIVIGVFKVFL